MSVVKRCCVCDEMIVDGRCVKCGMPYQGDRNFYHVNESMQDHVKHMSVKEKQDYVQTQKGYMKQPVVQPVRPKPGSMESEAVRKGRIGVIVFVIIMVIVVIQPLLEIFFS